MKIPRRRVLHLAARNYRPRCRRHRRRVAKFHALQVGQGPVGNYSATRRRATFAHTGNRRKVLSKCAMHFLEGKHVQTPSIA
jgi:hypothetical protein